MSPARVPRPVIVVAATITAAVVAVVVARARYVPPAPEFRWTDANRWDR